MFYVIVFRDRGQEFFGDSTYEQAYEFATAHSRTGDFVIEEYESEEEYFATI